MIRPFELLRPATVEEACRWLAEVEDSRPVGGGVALTILMKQGLFRPRALVTLRDIPGLSFLAEEPDGTLRVGAMCTQHSLEVSPLVRARFPVLAEAASRVGNIRVRCQTTVGGTVCEADPQSDVPPVLVALGASAVVAGVQGSRQVPLEQFYRGHYETVLERGEVVTEVRVPPLPPGTAGAYLKHVTGPHHDRPCLGVAALLRLGGDGAITWARVVVGGVHATPWIVREVEELLRGERPSPALWARAAEEAYARADPVGGLRGSAWYKREMVKVFVRRALEQAAARLPGVGR